MARVTYDNILFDSELEEWKKIKGYKFYSISNYGRVRNDKKNIIRKPTLGNNGYYVISLWHKDKKQRIPLLIHRLVAEYFVKGNTKECVNHIDGNKRNNYYKNLEWCTLAYNTKEAYRLKLIRNYRSIKINENGMEFRTITDCLKWLRNNGYPKARHSNIIMNIQGKRHIAYGHTYSYIEKVD